MLMQPINIYHLKRKNRQTIIYTMFYWKQTKSVPLKTLPEQDLFNCAVYQIVHIQMFPVQNKS